jgi:hypothetical protein
LEVSRENSHETFCCDAIKLPLLSNFFDASLCIAVLHHIASVERRYALISELVRITKDCGTVMIQAWAYEQGDESKRTFDTQDTMVPWKLNKRFLNHSSLNSSSSEQFDESKNTFDCKHVVEVADEFVFQRYCHMYKEGELENLCSSVPGCRIIESGWDKGNWFVYLKVDKSFFIMEESESAVTINRNEAAGPEHSLSALYTRSAPRLTSYISS